jgi:Tubulin-tyrosine ligase family
MEGNERLQPVDLHHSFTETSLMSTALNDQLKTDKTTNISHISKPTISSDNPRSLNDVFERSRKHQAITLRNENAWEPSVVKFHFISKHDLQGEKSLNPDLEGIENAIDQMRKARSQASENNKFGGESNRSKHQAQVSKRRHQELHTKQIKTSGPQKTLMLTSVSRAKHDKLLGSACQGSEDAPVKEILPPWMVTDFRTGPKLGDTKTQTKKEQLKLIKARIEQAMATKLRSFVQQERLVSQSPSPDIKKNKEPSPMIQVASREYEGMRLFQQTTSQNNKETQADFLLRCASVNYEGKNATISFLKHSSSRNLPHNSQEISNNFGTVVNFKYSEPMDDAMKDRILIGRRVKQTHSYMLIDDASRNKPTTKGHVFVKGAAVKVDKTARALPESEKRIFGAFDSAPDHTRPKGMMSKCITSTDGESGIISRSHLLDSRMRDLARQSIMNQQAGFYNKSEDAAALEQDFVIEEAMIATDIDSIDENRLITINKPFTRIKNAIGGYQINKNTYKTSSFLNNISQAGKSTKKLLHAGSSNQVNLKKGMTMKENATKFPSKTGLEPAYESFLVLAGYTAEWGRFADINNASATPMNPHADLAQTPAGIKCFVGEGNNQKLVVSLLKERCRVELESFVTRSMFSWTQKSMPNFKSIKAGKLPSAFKKVGWEEGSAHLGANLVENYTVNDIADYLINKKPSQDITQSQSENKPSRLFHVDPGLYLDLVELLTKIKEKSGLYRIEKPEFVIANHIKGLKYICRKVMLAQTILTFTKKEGIDPWEIIPVTYLVRGDTFDKDIEELIESKRKAGELTGGNSFQTPLIIKPGEFSNRGIGIGMSFDITELKDVASSILEQRKSTSWVIVQDYLAKPLLFKNRKFDLRCYGLVIKMIDRVFYFWYKQGYARTSSFEYDPDEKHNLKVHLTNEAVQVRGSYQLTQTQNDLECSNLETRFTMMNSISILKKTQHSSLKISGL